MKRWMSLFLCFFLLASLTGCSKESQVKAAYEGNMRTYYEMTDGTWQCDNMAYEQYLEIRGRMNGAACDTTFVYLSNVPITFEQAWKASGLSSNLEDYFSKEDAVLVEMRTDEIA